MTRLKLNNYDEKELDKIINEEVEQLKEAQKNILEYLNDQGEKVDTIEDNILKTEFNNIEAEHDMKIVRQNKRKNLSFVAGSLFLGTLLGTTIGPLGILPGAVVGGFIAQKMNSVI